MQSTVSAVFFDLGDTLGTVVRDETGGKAAGLIPYPYASETLAKLKSQGLKLGVISNTGSQRADTMDPILAEAGLLEFFDPELLVYSGAEGVTKASPEIFYRASKRAGLIKSSTKLLFVGEDSHEREVALSAGWRVCPHPQLVEEALAGQPLRFVRLSPPSQHSALPWREELQRRPNFLPMRFSGKDGEEVIGLTSQRFALELAELQFKVDFLGEPDLPLRTDLYLFRDDLAKTSGFLVSQGEARQKFAAARAELAVIGSSPEGVLAALPAKLSDRLDTLHFEAARHGHNLKLVPDPTLYLLPVTTSAAAALGGAERSVSLEPAAEFGAVSASEIISFVNRYSGVTPLNHHSNQSVDSRHVRHPGNALAVSQVVSDLKDAGAGRILVRRHRFTHAGRELENVEAELRGQTDELVLVTAHLDSTAAFDEHYDPAADAAPGADDDAGGMAAVVSIARRFAQLTKTQSLERSVRFVLFNAEEQGLIGSQAYARTSKARGDRIVGVWQMDMIGYNAEPAEKWEIHAGFTPSAAVEERSMKLAHLLRDVASKVTTLPSPQLHDSSWSADGDPAAGRSDHASFQAQGYPGVVVSEDFFVDHHDHPEAAEAPDSNPAYHSGGDKRIDSEYAAKITTAVGSAAWVMARNQRAANLSVSSSDIHTRKETAMATTMKTEGVAQSRIKQEATNLVELRKKGIMFDPQPIGSRVKVWKQDPLLAELGVRTAYLPSKIAKGPSDAAIKCAGTAEVLPDHAGDFTPNVMAPEALDAVHTFSVVRMALTFYERQLARSLPWNWNRSGGSTPISVYARGGNDENAYYSREDKELRFFSFHSSLLGREVYTCRSLDIVAHETGHAVLDSLQPGWYGLVSAQTGGLHESFGDLTSIFLALSILDLAEYVVAETKADLHQTNMLSALAEEFGASRPRPVTARPTGLRNAFNKLTLSEVTNEVHDISRVFTGGVYGVLADLFTQRRAPSKRDDAVTLHETSADLAGLLLQAMQRAPATNATFADVANGMISLAEERNDDDLVTIIKAQFGSREVIGSHRFDFPNVRCVSVGRCGTMHRAITLEK